MDSISDNKNYRKVCREATLDDSIFNTFKSIGAYRCILEHVSYEGGLEYLKIIKESYPQLIEFFKAFQTNDSVGNPGRFTYGDYGDFSPTTLRYIKVLGDLMSLFGSMLSFNIVEVGCGYGGQLKIIQDYFKLISYEIFDLPEAETLAVKYSEHFNALCCRYSNRGDYDLFISNYAFTELSKTLQIHYFKTVIPKCKRGYITCNFISEGYGVSSLSLGEMVDRIRSCGHSLEIIQERPLSHHRNAIIIWGR